MNAFLYSLYSKDFGLLRWSKVEKRCRVYRNTQRAEKSKDDTNRVRMALGIFFFLAALIAPLALAQITTPTVPTTAINLERGKAIAAQICFSCHIADGNSASVLYPKLAEQLPEYLIKQLKDFKNAARNNPVMLAFATALSAEDMRDVAHYFAQQKIKPGAAKNKERALLGEKIYHGGIAEKGVPACSACHGPNGAGMPAQFPRLAGQWAEYTVTQLIAFRDSTRNNGPMMHTISDRMSDREIKAVADYIAGLR